MLSQNQIDRQVESKSSPGQDQRGQVSMHSRWLRWMESRIEWRHGRRRGNFNWNQAHIKAWYNEKFLRVQ